MSRKSSKAKAELIEQGLRRAAEAAFCYFKTLTKNQPIDKHSQIIDQAMHHLTARAKSLKKSVKTEIADEPDPMGNAPTQLKSDSLEKKSVTNNALNDKSTQIDPPKKTDLTQKIPLKNPKLPDVLFEESFRTNPISYENLKSFFPELVLVHPQIPPNTGTIARMCAAMATRLHVVEPIGFSLSDKAVRRAGLDYWENVDLTLHANLEALDEASPGRRWVFVETGGELSPYEFDYRTNDLIVLGSETKGIPDYWMKKLISEGRGVIVTIPMYAAKLRSINLSCAAAMVLFQATEQMRKRIL